jgi:hypothetical protein|tara:strand:+ start:516 stop:629 length:114 start_codon:yes stop_codon:yes gene_type:complete
MMYGAGASDLYIDATADLLGDGDEFTIQLPHGEWKHA